MLSRKNILFFIIYTIFIFALQFFIARKHIYYGFNNDDWLLLALYKQAVNNPILDMAKALKAIGAHDFARAYYVGILFNFFGAHFQYYHIVNTLLKALAGLSLFPVVYLLFRKKFLAYLTTFLFSLHFSSFGALHDVFIGDQSLVVVCINIFLAIYIWAARNKFNLKIMFSLLALFLSSAFFDLPRFYPFFILLPFLELFNFWLNRSSTSLKAAILRLIFLYSPFIILYLYFPAGTQDFGIGKTIHVIKTGNFQLYTTLFASFGSTFIPQGVLDQVSNFAKVGDSPLYQDFGTFLIFLVFKFLILAYPILLSLGSVVLTKTKRFILSSLLLSICFFTLAFLAANHWIYLDPKLKAAVDPGNYFIAGLVGLFVFSTSISFFIEWLHKKNDYFLLALGLAPIFSLVYTYFVWILVDDSFIFMGVHNYLAIPAIGSSIYLAIIFYLAFQKLKIKLGVIRRIAALLITAYFFIFLIFGAIQVDKYYLNWLKLGYGDSDQIRYHTIFWQEVGKGPSVDKSPILIYLDTSSDDGYYYGANFIWDIPSLLTIEKGLLFQRGVVCSEVVTTNEFDKVKIKEINGQKMIVRSACGPDRYYKLKNFYAFKIINRELVPIKSEIIKQIRVE